MHRRLHKADVLRLTQELRAASTGAKGGSAAAERLKKELEKTRHGPPSSHGDVPASADIVAGSAICRLQAIVALGCSSRHVQNLAVESLSSSLRHQYRLT